MRVPLSIWLQATRPKTLPAAGVPVLIGSALAAQLGGFSLLPALICLCFALLIQVGTNFANDYYDGVRGTDAVDRLGPRRAVTSGLVTPSQMLRAALWVLGLAFLVGLSLVSFGGWWMLPVGLLCIVLALAYTGGPFPLAYLGLGDVFVVLFFGVVPVWLTVYVQSGALLWSSVWLGLACGLVANNLLVVNNYRDAEGDKRANKRTLVVRFGRAFARKQYALSLLAALLIPAGLGLTGYGWTLLLPLLLLGFPAGLLSIRFARSGPTYCNAVLAQSAAFLVLYGVLLSVCLVV